MDITVNLKVPAKHASENAKNIPLLVSVAEYVDVYPLTCLCI